LKAKVPEREEGNLLPTVEGTPQGGGEAAVISPLLANIALHGMEQEREAETLTHSPKKYPGGGAMSKERKEREHKAR
jgi:RNA-directed DNA polymerase